MVLNYIVKRKPEVLGRWRMLLCDVMEDITVKSYVMVHTNNSLSSFNFVKIGSRSHSI